MTEAETKDIEKFGFHTVAFVGHIRECHRCQKKLREVMAHYEKCHQKSLHPMFRTVDEKIERDKAAYHQMARMPHVALPNFPF